MLFIFTKKSEEGHHFLPLDDDSWGPFGVIHPILTLARLALLRWTLGVLTVGSFEPETSSDLEGVRTVGFNPDGHRGWSLAPPVRVLHHAFSLEHL